jgi:hypothetical protein
MESLALMVTLIISPAFFGGPIALALTFWKPNQASKTRMVVARVLAALSIAVGSFLLSKGISRGATNVGVLGIVTGAAALWRTRQK